MNADEVSAIVVSKILEIKALSHAGADIMLSPQDFAEYFDVRTLSMILKKMAFDHGVIEILNIPDSDPEIAGGDYDPFDIRTIEQRVCYGIRLLIGFDEFAAQAPAKYQQNKIVCQDNLEDLLHPIIQTHCYKLYKDGHLREAVQTAVIAVFDFIRERTGCQEDGDKLIGKVFSLEDPLLIMSELSSESGQNDQKGFMQIFKGIYQGVRNPKSHTLIHDLTLQATAQYLVFASLLARRIEEAKNPEKRV